MEGHAGNYSWERSALENMHDCASQRFSYIFCDVNKNFIDAWKLFVVVNVKAQNKTIKDLFNSTSCVPPPFTCPHPQIAFYLYTRQVNVIIIFYQKFPTIRMNISLELRRVIYLRHEGVPEHEKIVSTNVIYIYQC